MHFEAWGVFPNCMWLRGRCVPECFNYGGLSCDSGYYEGTGLVWEGTPFWVYDAMSSRGDGKVVVFEGEDDGLEAPPRVGVL
jgi:hypothetical protein